MQTERMTRLAAFIFAGVLAAGTAHAGPPLDGGPCQVGKGLPSEVAQLDLNGTYQFEGNSGGDVNFTFAAFQPGDDWFTGDWNGDDTDEVGRQADSTFLILDSNGNNQFDGGGVDDFESFGPGQGVQPILVGDFDMDNDDDIAKFNAGTNLFLADLNDNLIFDGNAGGDAFFGILPGLPGVPIVGDFNGDGADELGRVLDNNNFVIDANGNFVFDGVAGGDANFFFAPGQAAGAIPLVGDWNGDGTDEVGIYNSGSDLFSLDLNGNGVFDGNSGGDAFFGLALGQGPGIPVVCDWDGDGTDDVGKVVGNNSNWILDANSNRQFDGIAGGDVNDFFGPGGGTGDPIPAQYVTP